LVNLTEINPGQIWLDKSYYFNEKNSRYQSKYVLALAVTDDGDVLHAVFTSQPNGLTAIPACSTGLPRTGHHIGYINNLFNKETWVDFSSITLLDNMYLRQHLEIGKKTALEIRLGPRLFCEVLRCSIKLEDLSRRELSWIHKSIAEHICS